MTTPFTYLIGWKDLNVWYYGVKYSNGCHPSDLWTKYFTSSKYVREFVEANGSPDIIQVRRTFNSPELARDHESKVIQRMKIVRDTRFLNKGCAGKDFFATEETLAKAHQANVGRRVTSVTRLKMSAAGKGKSKSEEHRSRIAESNTGKTKSFETKMKISESRVGRFLDSANHLNVKNHTCRYCGVTSTKGNISRWHNEKCSVLKYG